MKNNINKCPYKASNNNQCTHKRKCMNQKRNQYCGYEKPENCEEFRDWLKKQQKSQIKALKPQIEVSEH